MFEGVGVSLGSLMGGAIMDRWGGAVLFRAFGIASFIFCALHFLVQLLLGRRTKQQEPGNIADKLS